MTVGASQKKYCIAIGECLVFPGIEVSPFIRIKQRNPLGMIAMNCRRQINECFQIMARGSWRENKTHDNSVILKSEPCAKKAKDENR
jgi:hypothetical protein